MRKIVRTLCALVVALVVSSASPVEAHTSSYCGHGTSGWWTKTVYTGGYTDWWTNSHWHRYSHRNWDTGQEEHVRWTRCPHG